MRSRRGRSAIFLSALAIFAFSIVVSLWPTRRNRVWLGARYFSSSLLALLFTGAMIYFIGITLQALSGSTSAQNTVISLGFAHVYFGRYVDDAEEEWLFSLTTPEVTQPEQQEVEILETPQTTPAVPVNDEATVEDEVGPGRISEGFGAPLWLLLLSVVGASLYTITLVVENLEKPLEFSPAEVRARVAVVVKHQFYLLFAPLGAIIVYQMLVAAGSASEPITLGLAALASGIALSAVLAKPNG